MRKSTLLAVLLGSLMLSNQGSASPISIDILPQTQDVFAGSAFNVDISISGLGDLLSPSVSTYDFDLIFDPTILSFSSLVFGDQLDIFGLGDVNSVDSSVAGMVNVYELSLDSSADLDAFQLPDFTLATLTFDTIGTGTSGLALSLNALGDSNGNQLIPIMKVATVTVNPSPQPIPAPATWLLFSLGMVVMFRNKPKH